MKLRSLDDYRAGLLPWQREALTAAMQTRVPGQALAWAGGRGSGKSATVSAIACMLAYLRPGAEIMLGMDTFPRLRDIHLPIMAPLARSLGAEFRATDNEFRWPSGSVVRLRHLEMSGDPGLGGSPVEGGNYHVIIADECQAVDSRYWTVFNERARVPVVDLAGDECAPLVITSGLPVNSWWCTRTAMAGGRVWRPKTRDNHHNGPDYEARIRATMTEARARAMCDGEELVPEGAIYSQFRPVDVADGGSLIDWRPGPNDCRYVLAGDLGFRFPHFVLFAEHVERAAWVMVDEWAPNETDIAGVSSDMRRTTCPRSEWSAPKDHRRPVDMLITDPAGAARSSQTGQSDLDIWALRPPSGYGMRPRVETRPERRGVVEGIHRAQLALEQRRLLMSADLYRRGTTAPEDHRTVARCLLRYAWDPRRQGEPLKDGVNDHGADAVRYFVREMLWHLGEPVNVSAWTAPESTTRRKVGGKGGW